MMRVYAHFRYLPAGDSAVVVEVGDAINPAIHRIIRGLMLTLRQQPIPGVRECIPTYRSVLIIYDPAHLWYDEVVAQLKERVARLEVATLPDPRIVTIPVRYGGADGPDLDVVAEHAHLTPDEVIALHAEPEYLVYMLGFTPGFCYLGGLNERLATPRRAEPRTRIPAGAVGIAGQQTGVYPIDSPGGWQLVGRTSLRLFDPHRDPPVLIQAGDVVRFVPENHYSGAKVSQSSTLPGFETLAGFGETLDDKTILQEQQRLLTVLQPGLLTTMQDLGRYGYGEIGMPVAGVMDAYAARVGNILLGNGENAAVLEITALGPILEFHQPTAFVIAGADMQPSLNHQPIDMWRVIQAQSGDILSFAGLRDGCRTYFAVADGFDVPLVMGSASTYLRGKIGGYEGRALQAGDRIPIKPTHRLACQDFRLPAAMLPMSGDLARVVLGPQDDAFTQKGIDTLLGSEYVVTHEADRMGYRLDGPSIELRGTADIISDGLALGAIQVPAHGRPIIMLADHQTTGGYAKIAHVIAVDIPILAQKKPGDRVRFAAIAMTDAQRLYREREQRIAWLRDAISAHIKTRCEKVADYTLLVNGQPYHVRVEEL